MANWLEKCVEFCKLLLLCGRSVLLVGAPGTGKTRLGIELSQILTGTGPVIETGRSELTYDTFMIYTELTERGPQKRLGMGGLAVLACWLRLVLGMGPVWLLFDEINRCNIEVVLGPLFTALDPEYRDVTLIPLSTLENMPDTELERIAAVLQLPLDDCRKALTELIRGLRERGFSGLPVPRSFRIIGTMNVFDRAHLFRVGAALTRRLLQLYVAPPYVEYRCRDSFVQDLISELRSLEPALEAEAHHVKSYLEKLLCSEVLIRRFTEGTLEFDYPSLLRVDASEVSDAAQTASTRLSDVLYGVALIVSSLTRLGLDIGIAQLLDTAALVVGSVLFEDIVEIKPEELLDLALASIYLPQVAALAHMLRTEALLQVSSRVMKLAQLLSLIRYCAGGESLTGKAVSVLEYELPATTTSRA